MNNKQIESIHFFAIIFFTIATFFMGIGYSALNGILFEINGSAVAMTTNTLEITQVSVSNSSNVVANNCVIHSFYHTLLNTTIELGNSNDASITYAVTVYNNLGKSIAYKDTTPSYDTQSNFYDNTGIKYEITGITKGEILQNHASKTFYVTFSYANGVSQNKVLNSILGFNFDDYYTVTYANITGFSTGTAIANENLVVDFGTNAPSSVIVAGANTYVENTNYTYTSGVLTVFNVLENITVTGITGGGGSGTQNDPYIVPDPTYDPDDVQPGYNNFPTAPGAPSVVAEEDANGNTVITSFEYTSASSNNPVTITPDNQVDTGVIALDGGAFTLHIKFRVDVGLKDQNNTYINRAKYVVSAFEKNGNVYNGFSINSIATNKMAVSVYYNKTRSSTTLSANSTSSINISSGSHVYDITVTYDPAGNNGYGTLTSTFIYDGGNPTTKTIRNTKNSQNNIPHSLTNAVVTIGGNGVDNLDDMGSMEVLEFSVSRL